jgi:hypothetical protein
MMSRCNVCHARKVNFVCSYCGAVEVNKRTYDINNMLQLVRGIPEMREPKVIRFASRTAIAQLTAKLVR